MRTLCLKEVDADVLVVGGGAGAAMAAIKAHDAGARVILASKSGFPAGASSMARGGFQAALGHSDPRDNPEVHYQDTLKAGKGLNNRRLVRVMAEGIIGVVADLEKWGANLIKKDGRFSQIHRVGCTYPRHLHHHDTTGKALMHCLSAQVRARGITVLSPHMVIEVLTDGERVCGAVSLDYKALELTKITARAIVLATGGAGEVFEVTDCPPALTGDGYALAFHLSVELIDMEMIDFQLQVCHPEPMQGFPPNSSGWIAAGARLYNGLGERYMRRHQPQTLEKSDRALINRAVGIEIFEGRGSKHGGVYLDLSDLPGDEIRRLGPTIAAAFERNGVDLTYQPMELAPGAHTYLGGIKIDENGATARPGLYAAGEVAGGVHGANRLGGNAVTDPLVFGGRAGVAAAGYALSAKAKTASWDDATLRLLLEREQGVSFKEVRHEIQAIMSSQVGIVRSESRLKDALSALGRVKQELLPKMAVGGSTRREVALELKGALETMNILTTGELIATAALNRRESRGAQYRIDFPGQGDDAWLKHVACYRDAGGAVACKLIEV